MRYVTYERNLYTNSLYENIAQLEECNIVLSHPKGYKDRSTQSQWNPKEYPWLIGWYSVTGQGKRGLLIGLACFGGSEADKKLKLGHLDLDIDIFKSALLVEWAQCE